MRQLRVFLFCAMLVALSGRASLGAPAKSPLPRPTDADWDAYKTINAAMADPKQKGKTFPASEVQGWLRAQNWLDEGKQAFDFERLEANFEGLKHPPYAVRDLKLFKETPYSKTAGATGAAAASPNTGIFPGPPGSPWQGIKLRQSYSEVLSIEDPSQDSVKKVETLQGALFSYARNILTDGDS